MKKRISKKTFQKLFPRFAIVNLSLIAIGAILALVFVSAAPTTVSLEAESGTGQGYRTVSNSTASAGAAVRFGLGAQNDGSPAGINGRLRVCGLQICNQYNQPIQLRGMSTHGLQWYPWGDCINTNSLNTLRHDWGADILRVSLYVQEGGYETNPTYYTNMATSVIDAAIAQGMYVLIDWHQLDPGDPNYNTERAKTYFTHMANRYKNSPNVIYEIANEPNGVNWATIKRYADQLVPHIRAIDPNGIIVIGTPGWDTFGLSDGTPGSDIYNNQVQGTNLMYTYHFYANSHRESSLARLDEASSRVPVFVTEWGTQLDTGDGPNDFTMSQRYIDLMAQKKISWTSWNFSDDFRSGAVLKENICPNGPWNGNQLKESGTWVRERIRSPADDFPTN